MNAFNRIMSFSWLIYLDILAKARNFLLTFLRIFETCSEKSSLLSIVTPKSLTDLLPLIISSSIFRDIFSSF